MYWKSYVTIAMADLSCFGTQFTFAIADPSYFGTLSLVATAYP